jgi:hypothetical protein
MDAFQISMGRETSMAKHTRITGYMIIGLMIVALVTEFL